MRLIEIPDDGVITIPIMRGTDTIGYRKIDLSNFQTVDAVPVVLCKDCLWYENLTLICHLHSQFYDGGRYWDMFRPDDFCSYAEPKEGAENETD